MATNHLSIAIQSWSAGEGSTWADQKKRRALRVYICFDLGMPGSCMRPERGRFDWACPLQAASADLRAGWIESAPQSVRVTVSGARRSRAGLGVPLKLLVREYQRWVKCSNRRE
jgi:hypothetical protein